MKLHRLITTQTFGNCYKEQFTDHSESSLRSLYWRDVYPLRDDRTYADEFLGSLEVECRSLAQGGVQEVDIQGLAIPL